MADTRLSGQLSPKDPALNASYDGHSVRLEFSRTTGQGDQAFPYPASLATGVESDGKYTLLVDTRVLEDRSARLQVRSPLGTSLAEAALHDLLDQDRIRPIVADPEVPLRIAPHPDRFKGQHQLMTVRALDRDGTQDISRRQVLIYGVPAGPADGSAQPALVFWGRTDQKGYVSGPYPRGQFMSAFAEVARIRAPLRLEEDGSFPLRVVFAVTLPPEDPGAGADPAGGQPPRTPDEEDLLNSPESFSSDLGTGRCIDFTVPNRTLEELPFYKIVRTTDPDIKGTHLEPPIKLPPGFGKWIRQLAFGHGTIDSKLKVRPAPEATFEPAVGIVGAAQPGAETLNAGQPAATGNAERAATNAAANTSGTPSLISFETQGMRSAAQWRAAIDTQSIDVALAEALPSLSAETLRSVLVDPDEFTPVTLMTAERLSAHQLLKDLLRIHRSQAAGRAPLDELNSVDWDDTPTFYQATSIAHGHILQFRQVWKADGYSLGDLLHSVPLAPCQKKQIVTIDWDRREDATRTEDLTEREVLFADLVRDRDVKEIMDTALSEEIDGGSTAKTYGGGGGLGFAIGPFVLGAGGGGSGADSEAWQDSSREISARTMHELKDRINQSAAAVRSQRATVVQTLAQGERSRVETEVIANHNHCHALTIQHFEVLRHFQVSEELAEVRECLFVPFLMSRFHDARVLRWRECLGRNLRKRSLQPAFDAIERIQLNYVGVDLPLGMFAEEPLQALDGELSVRITIARPRDPKKDEADYFEKVWPFWPRLIGGNPADIYERYLQDQQLKDRIFRDQLAPQIAERFIASLRVVLIDEDGAETETSLDPALASKYRPGDIHAVTLADSGNTPPIARKRIVALAIRTDHELPEHSQVIVEGASFIYHTRHLRHFLYQNDRVRDDLLLGDPVYLPTAKLTQEEERNPRAEDQQLRRRLLTHLNANLEYYHKAMWWCLDKERLFILLDGFLAPHSGGRSVASVVENNLVGIVGNSLVFPVVAGYQLDPRYRTVLDRGEPGKPAPDLFDLYAPLVPDPPRLLSVPTKGVFAEAVMGACNSCEKIDESRFWRWSESPCPDDPARISEVSAASRAGAAPNLTATGFPAPIVSFQNIPQAPDPGGLGAALALLGRGDLFRDITGLTQNQRNALGTLQASLATAQAFGQEAVQLAHAQAAQRTIDQTLKSLEEARNDGRLTGEAAREITKGALQALIGQQAAQDSSIMDSASAQEAMGAALDSSKSKVRVTEESAGEQQTVEVSQEGGPGAEGEATMPTEIDDTLSDFIDCPVVIDELAGPDFKIRDSSYKISFLQKLLREKMSSDPADRRYLDWLSVGMDGKIIRKKPDDASRFQVKAEMRICYPADQDDPKKLRKQPLLSMRGYPVVVLVHGQHAAWVRKGTTARDDAASTAGMEVLKDKWACQVENHKGYEYLQRFLASKGIVSVSILTNLANQVNALVRMRSEMVLRTLDLLRDAAADPGSRYYNKLDFTNVGLMGHSRGGDCVIDVMKNQDPARHPGHDPYGIRAVCALAPTDLTGTATGSGRLDATEADGASLLVVYGTQDSDVDGFREVGNPDPAGTGFRHYDRATAPKAMVFIRGATHNRFNTRWGSDEGHLEGDRLDESANNSGGTATADCSILNQDVSRPEHEKLGREYIGGFFRGILRGDPAQLDILTGQTDNSSSTDVALQWQFGSPLKVIDEYDPSHLGEVHADASVELFAPITPTTTQDQHICHHTRALRLPTRPGARMFFVENPGRDPEDYTELLFRMALAFDLTSAATINATTLPKFTITLKDNVPKTASVSETAVYAANPLAGTRPDRHVVDISRRKKAATADPSPSPVRHDVTKLFFETYRVPLTLFPGVDLHKLDEIRFEFAEPGVALDVYVDSICLVKR